MTNKEIAGLLKLTAALLELHEENQFKIRTYTNAVFNIEKQEEALFGKEAEELATLDGIGKGLSESLTEIFDTGTFELLEDLKSKTPVGLIEMIDLKGLGPKKIKAIWKELGITTVDELYEACQKGEIARLKGFGAKTQETIKDHLEFVIAQKGKLLLAEAEPFADRLLSFLKERFRDAKISLTGAFRRKTEVVDNVEILIGLDDFSKLEQALTQSEVFDIDLKSSGPFTLRGSFPENGFRWVVRLTDPNYFESKLMRFTGSGDHLFKIVKDNQNLHQYLQDHPETTEEKAYEVFDLPFILPEQREGSFELIFSKAQDNNALLELHDLRGPIHNHSRYSDGKNSIREMAQYCIDAGYEYLGLSDHSKSAFYANGLREFDIQKQHEEIDALNSELAPFVIFKGIESDILADGSLDYTPDVLASFDFIVASIHSNLNMDIAKATERLIKANENPYTTILGHPTARLLLRRKGYPIDHQKVIDACARNKVIIEINSNPWRLDLDWRWVKYALDQEVILSINPDAHELEGFNDMKYGVYMGRKGGLTKDQTFNAWPLDRVQSYFEERKANIK